MDVECYLTERQAKRIAALWKKNHPKCWPDLSQAIDEAIEAHEREMEQEEKDE